MRSGPGATLCSLLTAWVCGKKPAGTPVFLSAWAAAAATEQTTQPRGGGGTHLSVPLLSSFLLSFPPSRGSFPFYFYLLFHFSDPWAFGVHFALILDLMLIVHTHCPLEGGLDPGLQLMLTRSVIISNQRICSDQGSI